MARKRRPAPEGLLFDKGKYTELFKDVGIDPDTLSEADYKAWVKYLRNEADAPPELVSVKGQLSLEDMYDQAEGRKALQGATRAAQEAEEARIRKFATGAPGLSSLAPEGPPLPSPERRMSLEEIKQARAAAMRSISEEQILPRSGRAQDADYAAKVRGGGRTSGPLQLPKGKWKAAGLVGKGLKGAGFALGGLGAAVGVVDMFKEPAKAAYDYVTKDPVEEQGRMLRAREALIRLRQRQEADKRETERLRGMNLQRIAQLSPQLALELSVGRTLPKGAAVIGGRPRTDVLDSIADAMAEGTLDPSVPDPLSGVM